MRNKTTILIIGPLPPPMGGIATYVDDMLKSDIITKYNVLHLNTVRILKIKKSIPANLMLFLKNTMKLVYLLSFKRPKIVHIQTSSYMSFWEKSVFLLISKSFFAKVVFHIHGGAFNIFYENNRIRIKKNLIRFLLKIPDKVFVLSNSWKFFFSQLITENKISVIPNAVYYNLYSSDKFANFEFINPSCYSILFSGLLTKNKGVFDILDAISIVINKYKNVKFIFAGKEDTEGEMNKIRKISLQKNINNHIFLAGELTKIEMINMYKKSDIFILPSYREGMPISLLEAMAAGLPIISTSVGGIPEFIVEGENGFLITPGDYVSLADKIIKLIENKELRLMISRNNQEKIREKYDWSMVSTKICEEYEKLL